MPLRWLGMQQWVHDLPITKTDLLDQDWPQAEVARIRHLHFLQTDDMIALYSKRNLHWTKTCSKVRKKMLLCHVKLLFMATTVFTVKYIPFRTLHFYKVLFLIICVDACSALNDTSKGTPAWDEALILNVGIAPRFLFNQTNSTSTRLCKIIGFAWSGVDLV